MTVDAIASSLGIGPLSFPLAMEDVSGLVPSFAGRNVSRDADTAPESPDAIRCFEHAMSAGRTYSCAKDPLRVFRKAAGVRNSVEEPTEVEKRVPVAAKPTIAREPSIADNDECATVVEPVVSGKSSVVGEPVVVSNIGSCDDNEMVTAVGRPIVVERYVVADKPDVKRHVVAETPVAVEKPVVAERPIAMPVAANPTSVDESASVAEPAAVERTVADSKANIEPDV